jgi:uncharacterized protein RhaS with RHS repeats
MSPDPRGNSVADLTNPQSWNLYAYVLNNPLKYVDPTGLDCSYLNAAGTDIENGGLDQNSNSGECKQNGGACGRVSERSKMHVAYDSGCRVTPPGSGTLKQSKLTQKAPPSLMEKLSLVV